MLFIFCKNAIYLALVSVIFYLKRIGIGSVGKIGIGASLVCHALLVSMCVFI